MTTGIQKGRNYDRIIEVLARSGRALCPHELDAFNTLGCTEATAARRCREAAALGLVVPSKRKAQNGAMLTQYSLPVVEVLG